MLPSSAPPAGLAGEFSCPFMVKLGLQMILSFVCREHVVGIINLLSSLGTTWVLHHIVLLFGGMSPASVARFGS